MGVVVVVEGGGDRQNLLLASTQVKSLRVGLIFDAVDYVSDAVILTAIALTLQHQHVSGLYNLIDLVYKVLSKASRVPHRIHD